MTESYLVKKSTWGTMLWVYKTWVLGNMRKKISQATEEFMGEVEFELNQT